MSTTPIFIPTYGRKIVRTLDSLDIPLLNRVLLVVDSSESGNRLSRGIVRWIMCPCQGTGVMNVRDWLVSYCKQSGIDCCIMLDDDIRLSIAYFKEGRKKFRSPRDGELLAHFDAVERLCLCKGVGFASFSQTYFNTTPKVWARYKDNASTYFVNVPAVDTSHASFLGSYIEDRKFLLETIEAGLEVWSDTYIGVTKIGKHAVGGQWASGNRGPKHEMSLREFSTTYPRFVRLRKSTNAAYVANYGTDLSATFYMQRLADAVKRGENVRA
jgi:hypothetical protein